MPVAFDNETTPGGGSVSELLAAVAARLRQVEEVPADSVVEEDRADLPQRVKVALSKLRLSIVVYLADMANTANASPAPNAKTKIGVLIQEKALGRQAGDLPASHAAELIIRALHLHAWRTGKCLIWDALATQSDPASMIYELTFSTNLTIAQRQTTDTPNPDPLSI